MKPGREPSGDADVYVTFGKPGREPSGDAVVEVAVSPNLEDQRASLQAELTSLAEREGLSGLSPAFLQRTEVCSGLSPASVSGCTTAELQAAFPGDPR